MAKDHVSIVTEDRARGGIYFGTVRKQQSIRPAVESAAAGTSEPAGTAGTVPETEADSRSESDVEKGEYAGLGQGPDHLRHHRGMCGASDRGLQSSCQQCNGKPDDGFDR